MLLLSLKSRRQPKEDDSPWKKGRGGGEGKDIEHQRIFPADPKGKTNRSPRIRQKNQVKYVDTPFCITTLIYIL